MSTPARSLLLFALLVLAPLAAHAAPNSTTAADQFGSEVVRLTNEVRASHNVPPLKRQKNLDSAAAWMAGDMAHYDYIEHTDRKGRDIDPRLPDFGYTDYETIGENVAGGQSTPAEVVHAWMASPGHRRNILDPSFREIGVGYIAAPGSHFRHFWAQDFGARFNTFPVVVANESTAIMSPVVHLYIYGGAETRMMRFSNDGNTWSEWEPYKPRREWELASGSGHRVVYAELRSAGPTARISDEVELLPLTVQMDKRVALGSR